MKAAFMKSPNKFIVKDVDMRQLKESEVLVKVGACGLCGYDLILSAGGTEDWQPFGHEVSGLVVEKGRLADNVQIGEKVVLQSGTFDRYSEHVLNGRTDLDTKGKVLWPDDGRTMGFAEYMIVPMELCVPFDELTFEEACLTEPLGVALDLVQTADIRLNDNVLVWGLGPIGLMALKLACSMGAAVICGASRSYAVARNDLAMKFGAKDVIFTDTVPIEEYGFPAGGIDKILLTAPPSEIPSSIKLCNRGGIIAYLGIE
ncbi:MAG: medium chain dehydrogenase/reductase family protein [Eubacteriales bacterium]|nr:medium chain dehydrogenase/reductase family protein [Eubacteriales bacterium]